MKTIFFQECKKFLIELFRFFLTFGFKRGKIYLELIFLDTF